MFTYHIYTRNNNNFESIINYLISYIPDRVDQNFEPMMLKVCLPFLFKLIILIIIIQKRFLDSDD